MTGKALEELDQSIVFHTVFAKGAQGPQYLQSKFTPNNIYLSELIR